MLRERQSKKSLIEKDFSCSKSCFKDASNLLLRQSHFTKELALKLKRKGYFQKALEETLKKCQELGYLDDAHNLSRFISRLEEKGYGPFIILEKVKLKHGPIEDSDLVNQIWENERETLRAFLSKKYPIKIDEKKDKIARLLQRRGFSYESIRFVVDEIV